MAKTSETTTVTGLLLTQQWHDHAGRCEVVLTGKGENGPFELIIPERPVFFVKHALPLPEDVRFVERRALPLTDFDGNRVDALYFETYARMREGRERVREIGAYTYEGDLNPADRFLMERFINGGVEIAGVASMDRGVAVFEAPRIRHATVRPRLSLMSLDIETSPEEHVWSVAYQFRDETRDEVCRVYICGEGNDTETVFFCPTEEHLLNALLRDVALLDPDLLAGWNILGFDLPVLHRRCEVAGIPFTLGRRGRLVRFSERNGRSFVEVHGRFVLDGIPALRSSFFQFENFKLETVANELLGRGKIIGASNEAKVAEIGRMFREDKPGLAEYNLEDCRLVTEIFDKTDLINLMITRVGISGMLFDHLGRSVGSFDHFYLPRLHRRGMVAPDRADIHAGMQAAGGLILSPQPGLHEHVAVLDFRSLYPSVIRTFCIDPLARVRCEEHPVRTPYGGKFSRTEHILPDFIRELIEQRAQAKRAGNDALAQAIKILMNSFYGVMGTGGCRFYHYDLPSNITGTGQWVLRTAQSMLEEQGLRVLYGDTDSLFVQLSSADAAQPFKAGERLVSVVNQKLADMLRQEFDVDSALDLEFEKYYRRLYLSRTRHGGEGGAAKRYAGQRIDSNGDETIEFKGLETVRSDWTPLARRFQRELFTRLFHEQELAQWVKSVVEDLREGRLDAELALTKRVRRALGSYEKTTPPHIRAALQLPASRKRDLRSVTYVMTHRGPVPVELPHDDIDYEHYVERQLRPLAEGILELEGHNFDELTGKGVQLKLF